ncbi:MAG: hypothetical protein OQJ81_12585, partial [Melioribacteraceae bacterium]|nr:hypothetical protein [Melioribacteraceae bacterium]
PAASEIRVEDWAEDVRSGSVQVFPEQEGDVTIQVNGVETVERVLADEGTLSIVVWNKLPVEIVLRGIRIQNSVDQSVIAERTGLDPHQWIAIEPLQNISLSFPVNGKVITNSLEYVGTIWSGGSDGERVPIPAEAGTTILALFKDLVIGEATAALPVQNFQFTNSIILDDSTKISEAYIGKGNAQIIVSNNIDANLHANLLISNLFDDNNKPFEANFILNKKETNQIINIPSLKNWIIRSSSPGIPTNELEYVVQVITDSTGDITTVTKNDDINFHLNFAAMTFSSFEGQLKPTRVDVQESGFSLDYGDIKNQLHYGEIDFKNALFYLDLNTSIDIELLLNGEILATNGIDTYQMPISEISLPTEIPHKINITELLNRFSSDLPDSFSIIGSAMINPNYKIAKIEMGDSIFGTVNYEIPLNIGIAEGSFKDTLDIDLGDFDEEEINKFNYGEVTFKVKNSVPVGLRFNAVVLDSSFNQIITIPNPAQNDFEFMEVANPEVTEAGDLLSIGESTQTLIMYGDEIKSLLENPYLEIQVFFSTAGSGSDPVKFKTSNKISFEVTAKAEYKVDLN